MNLNQNLKPHWQTEMERHVGHFLRGGVWLCAGLLGLGIAVGLVPGAMSQSTALIQIGTAALILLPICRVALTLILCLRNRDYTFVGITGFVLTILLIGLIFGKDL